ncbi:MAG: hypothetical protein ABI091_22525 [Ferruginibacter sp.]
MNFLTGYLQPVFGLGAIFNFRAELKLPILKEHLITLPEMKASRLVKYLRSLTATNEKAGTSGI